MIYYWWLVLFIMLLASQAVMLFSGLGDELKNPIKTLSWKRHVFQQISNKGECKRMSVIEISRDFLTVKRQIGL